MAAQSSRLNSYRQSIGRRLFFTHLWVGLVLAFGVAAYFYFAAERALDEAFSQRFQEAARAFALSLPAELLQDAQAERRIEALLRNHALLQSGRLLTHHDGEWRSGAGVSPSPPVRAPTPTADLLRGSLLTLTESRAASQGRAVVVLGDDRYLELQGSHSGKHEQLAALRLHALGAFVVAVLLSALMAALLSRHARRLLKRFALRCQEIAEGRFRSDSASAVATPTEFSDFAEALEGMAERLGKLDAERDRALTEAQSARDRLEASMRERSAELDRLNSVLRKEIEQRCQLEAVLAEAAATDALTRLLNRRGMVELLEQLATRTHQQRRHFCVAIADIDHFKSINDQHGHAIGDRVLAAVANRLRNDLKGEEAASRWGGEEFLLVWPEVPLAAAESRANSLREALSNRPLFDGAPRVTLSFGLVEYSGLDPLDACLVRADKALYRAKQQGRDRVVVS